MKFSIVSHFRVPCQQGRYLLYSLGKVCLSLDSHTLQTCKSLHHFNEVDALFWMTHLELKHPLSYFSKLNDKFLKLGADAMKNPPLKLGDGAG